MPGAETATTAVMLLLETPATPMAVTLAFLVMAAILLTRGAMWVVTVALALPGTLLAGTVDKQNTKGTLLNSSVRQRS